MTDKTKEELIEEINLLQKRIAEFGIVSADDKQQQIRQLATVVLDSNDAITLKDFDGRIIVWNHGAEQMYGYSEKEALEMNIDHLTPPRKVSEQREFTRRLIAGETVVSFETQRVTKDGRILDVWLTVTKVLDDTRKPIGIATIERDITERKQAEENIKSRKEFVETVINSLHSPFYVVDTDYNIVLSNKAAMEKGVEIGRYCYQATHRQQKPCSGEHGCPLREVLRTKKSVVKEHVHFDKDGNSRLFEVRGDPIFDKDGQVIQMIESSIDITERKKAEEELVESEEKFRTLVNNINIGIYRITPGPQGHVIEANPATANIFGYASVDEFLKIQAVDVYQDKNERARYSEDLVRLGSVNSKELHLKKKDGTPIICSLNETVHFNEKGEAVWFDGVVEDITERKRIEQQGIEDQEVLKRQTLELNSALKESLKSREILSSMLADNNQIREKLEQRLGELKLSQEMLIQSEKLASLGKLVSSMAHEVNNPLMIISGNAQLSLMEGTKEEEIKNNLEIIVGECRRAKNIIQRLLKFSRPSKGEIKEVDINKSIETVVGIVEHQFKLVNVEIKRNYQENLPLISIDDQEMQEVFINLINNAAEAMLGGGVITITTSLEGDSLSIVFKDTGSGIPEESKKKIFEPFFTTKEKGTGLGLPVCYGIIKAHNGEIKFESELNKGTTVSVLLPLGEG